MPVFNAMIVWNPVDRFVSKLASSRQRYRCRVDGQDEYRGESLPTGTQAEVLAWIEARYKLLGELYVFSHFAESLGLPSWEAEIVSTVYH